MVASKVAPIINSSTEPTCLLTTTLEAPITVGPPTFTLPHQLAIADTGSTAHFGTIDAPVINKRLSLNPISIRTPNGTIMTLTHEADLDLPMLPPAARHIHIVPELASSSLISMGQLCDAGCSVAFTATDVNVSVNDTVVLTGHRTPNTLLWHFPLPIPTPAPPVNHSALATIDSATPAELVAFAHAALFSPALSTLHRALSKGFITNFPGITPTLLRKHPPQSIAMIKGHLDQTRQNQRSTKQPTTAPPIAPPPGFPTDP
jgi:hypothetical protein